MNVIVFPTRLRTRQRFYLDRLQATRRNYPITANECTLVRQLRGCAPRDREFIRHAVADLHRARSRRQICDQAGGGKS